MKKINLYESNIQVIIRIISLIAIIILVISNTNKVINLGFNQLMTLKYEFITFILNCLSIILFFCLIIYPTKLEMISFVAFIYGSQILVFEPQNNMGILMFGLSVITLHARGIFNRHKKIRGIISLVIYFILILSELRFEKDIFFSYILEKIAYSFVLFLCLFFLQVYIFDVFETNSLNCILDLQKYPELKKRDAEWLVEILNGTKYEALAINYHMSLGSVKNRLKIIFGEIGIGDKQGFLNKYSDYEICYGDDFSSIKKKKRLFNI